MKVFVNEVRLSEAEIAYLSRTYGDVAPGRYWYDPATGRYGFEGGPAAGRIQAHLRLGGPFDADASGGRTGVFVNGRESHPVNPPPRIASPFYFSFSGVSAAGRW